VNQLATKMHKFARKSTDHLSLGARSKSTDKYVMPHRGEKTDKYVCPGCEADVVLCKGDVRRHYFRHTAKCACSYFDHPSESQIHKDAKSRLAARLRAGEELNVERFCSQCATSVGEWEVKLEAGCRATKEHRFQHEGRLRIADVAVLCDDDSLYAILEVCHTHTTKELDRPEPWFELNATSVVSASDENEFVCQRREVCTRCLEKERAQKQWLAENEQWWLEERDRRELQKQELAKLEAFNCLLAQRQKEAAKATKAAEAEAAKYRVCHDCEKKFLTGGIMEEAIERGHMSCFRNAVRCGHLVNGENIALAVKSGSLDHLKWFVEHEVDVKRDFDNHRLLDLAAKHGHVKCLAFLHETCGLEWGTFYSQESNAVQSGVCMIAAQNGNLACLKYALERGCEWCYGSQQKNFTLSDCWKHVISPRCEPLSIAKWLISQGCPPPESMQKESLEVRLCMQTSSHPLAGRGIACKMLAPTRYGIRHPVTKQYVQHTSSDVCYVGKAVLRQITPDIVEKWYKSSDGAYFLKYAKDDGKTT
jgi:hypothetical protein